MNIGERLKEERERLKLSQTSLAEKVGVHRKSQKNYETNIREPSASYLNAIAEVGVDVAYVMTGIKCVKSTRNLAETSLLESYRLLPENQQRALINYVMEISSYGKIRDQASTDQGDKE